MLAVVLVACGSDSDDDASSEAAPTTAGGADQDECPSPDGEEVILSASRPIMGFAPFYLALETGAFADAGLDVKIEPLSSSEALAPLAQGRIDGVITSYNAGFLNAVDSDVDLRWVMPAYEAPPEALVGVWARTDVVGTEDAPTPENLAGESLASPTGQPSLNIARALTDNGLSVDDVTITQLSGADGLSALENGGVAAAWLSDPLWLEAVDNPDLRLLGGVAPGINGSGLVIGPGLIDRPDVAVTLARVIGDVIEEHLGEGHFDDDETVELLAEILETDVESIRAGVPLMFDPELSLDGAEAFLDDLQEFYMGIGSLEYDEPMDTSTLIDASFVERAKSCP